MTRRITKADIESLCGRPGAFERFVMQLLEVGSNFRADDRLGLQRFGEVAIDRREGVVWWLWPQDPELDVIPELIGKQRRGLSWALPSGGELQVALARAPANPADWAARLAAELREHTGRSGLSVRVHGPSELERLCRGAENSLELAWFRTRWALAERSYDCSDCERALMSALDRGEDASEHWLVVADELQRRGDPTGETLALALALEPNRPTLQRKLSREYLERESARMVRAERHTQMLAFVDNRGRTHAIDEFVPGEHDGRPFDGHTVQLWAERVGPFFVRLLALTHDPQWRGLGLPDAVLDAPELRYLSATRMSSIHPDCADVSGRDLSGFVLTPLVELGPGRPVFAYEASLRGCDLRGADLSRWRLDGADLRGAVADIHTGFGQTSLVEARVSPELRALLDSWNAGRHHRYRGRSAGVADLRGIAVDSAG